MAEEKEKAIAQSIKESMIIFREKIDELIDSLDEIEQA